ncbi:MAG: hypothetical protein SPG87_01260 [Eubacteriales bacterium]|nr:hypothetical protein [Eubacteriales bacterium]
MKSKQRLKKSAKYVCYVAIMAATLTVGKLALSFIPNVEVVTLLIICYSSTFGRKYAIPATLIFCTVEIAIYGFGTWVLLYYIHWNMLSVISSFALKKQKLWVATLIAVLCTAFFGVLSTGIDVIFAGAYGVPKSELGKLYSAYYVRGIWFYVVHVVSNLLIVTALNIPLTKVLNKIQNSGNSATNLLQEPSKDNQIQDSFEKSSNGESESKQSACDAQALCNHIEPVDKDEKLHD